MMLELQKEWRFGLRTARFLILAAGFLFFAMLTPVMMKLVLPGVIKSQMPGISPEMMEQMFMMTQLSSIQSYMGDMYEIGSVMVAFTLCGLMAQEIRENTLVLPLCSGTRFVHIIAAKMLVFGAALVIVPTAALTVNYLYSGLLFSFEARLLPILRSGLLQGVYMVFLLSCLVWWGALFKKPMAAGFMALLTVYASGLLGSVLHISSYLPSGLLDEAMLLTASTSPTLLRTLLMTLLIILVLLAATLLRLGRMEWNER